MAIMARCSMPPDSWCGYWLSTCAASAISTSLSRFGVLVWSPLAGGLLSGKYRRSSSPDTGRHVGGYREPVINDWDKLYDIVDVIVELAESRGVPPSQIVLAWLLGRPGVTSVIIGGRNEMQLRENLASTAVLLREDERMKLQSVSLPILPYPYWHQALSVSERLGPIDLDLLDPYIRANKAGSGGK